MIIECDKCNTKFRLDDSKIKPNGVKVRCTKCQNVFIVTPPPPPEEVLVEEVFGPDTPFGEKPPEIGEKEQAEAREHRQEEEGETWGIFNSGADPEGTGEQAQDDGHPDDGSNEAPELSFGGPDFSALTDPSPAQGDSGEDEPWFEGTGGDTDDGFPEVEPGANKDPFEEDATPFQPDSPDEEEGPGADKDPFEEVTKPFQPDSPDEEESPGADKNTFGEDAPSQGSALHEDGLLGNDFSVEEAAEEPEPFQDAFGAPGADAGLAPAPGAPLKPVNEFDFGFDDEEDEPEDASGDEETDGVEEEDFELTPPPAPTASRPEHSVEEKVIPFSAGYGRSGKPAAKDAGAKDGEGDNRFEDLFSRTLSKTAGEPSADLGLDDEEFEEEDSPAKEQEAPAQRTAGKGVILAVLIFVLGAGAVYFSGIIDTIARTLSAPAQTETVEIENISGYFAENKNFGKFFVIEAKIKNASDTAQPIKTITGVIYGDKGNSIATRSVSPGRLVNQEDLKNLTKQELLNQFRDSSGGVIPPRGTVPVMVPFTEIPAGMSEYGLKIVRE